MCRSHQIQPCSAHRNTVTLFSQRCLPRVPYRSARSTCHIWREQFLSFALLESPPEISYDPRGFTTSKRSHSPPPHRGARPVPSPATRLTGFMRHLGESGRTNDYLFARYYSPSRATAPSLIPSLAPSASPSPHFCPIKCHHGVRFRTNFALINSRVRTNQKDLLSRPRRNARRTETPSLRKRVRTEQKWVRWQRSAVQGQPLGGAQVGSACHQPGNSIISRLVSVIGGG